MFNDTMIATDSINGSLAECYITIDDERYRFMQLINFEAKYNINVSEIPILGRTSKGHKPTPGNGEWSATAHYNQSVMRRLALDYANTGVLPYFDIQVTNEDTASSAGSQTIVLKDCLIDGVILAKFNAEAEYLDEDISGTFESWEMPQEFDELDGMR